MSGREAILNRVREALSVPSDAHVRHAPASKPTGDGYRAWLPQVEDTYEARVAIFTEYSKKLQTEFIRVGNKDAAKKIICDHAQNLDWKNVYRHGGTLIDKVLVDSGLKLTSTDNGYDINELEACDVGITECDALIAQTGSVVEAGERDLAVQPLPIG